jgi:hypothetical protein
MRISGLRLTVGETKGNTGVRCALVVPVQNGITRHAKKEAGWPSSQYTQNSPEVLALWGVLILVN